MLSADPSTFFTEGPQWRWAPSGVWVIQGRWIDLNRALTNGSSIEVRKASGEISKVRLEHVTDVDRHGNAYGWPEGTRAGTFRRSTLETTLAPAPHTMRKARRHNGTRRAARRR